MLESNKDVVPKSNSFLFLTFLFLSDVRDGAQGPMQGKNSFFVWLASPSPASQADAPCKHPLQIPCTPHILGFSSLTPPFRSVGLHTFRGQGLKNCPLQKDFSLKHWFSKCWLCFFSSRTCENYLDASAVRNYWLLAFAVFSFHSVFCFSTKSYPTTISRRLRL